MGDRGGGRLETLTGLRFFAAAAIVVHHLRGTFGFDVHVTWPLDNAVSFFFVLSGFILTHVYGQLETAATIKHFWLARFARIWPLHAVTLAFAWAAFYPGEPGLPWLANIALLQSWIPIQHFYFSYNAVSWSISTEAFFYLMFPLLIFRFSRTWWWKLLLSFFALLAMAVLSDRLASTSLDAVSQNGLIYVNPLANVFQFTLGMATALLWKRASSCSVSARTGTILEAAAIFIFLMVGEEVIHTTQFIYHLTGSAGLTNWIGHGGGTCIPAAALIFVMAHQAGRIGRMLATRPIVFLGEISFSIYMTHQLIIYTFSRNKDLFARYPDEAIICLMVCVIIAASALCWYWIERPARVAIVRLSAERTGPELQAPIAL